MEETNKSNPKALNIDAIKRSQVKVTLGFKCNPAVKLDLTQKANKLGLTLSEYVENLIMNSERLLEKLKDQEQEEKERLTLINIEQKEKIDFYEGGFLKSLFSKCKNQYAEYVNERNEIVNLKINNIEDLFTIIVNSFKLQNDEADPNTISIS